MKIKVRADSHRFTLLLPGWIVFGRLGVKIINTAVAQKEIRLTQRQAGEIRDALKQAKRDFGKLTLVDVRSKNGEMVKITL